MRFMRFYHTWGLWGLISHMRFLATQECISDYYITNIRCIRISVTCHCESVSYSQFEIVTLLVSHGALGDQTMGAMSKSVPLPLDWSCCSWLLFLVFLVAVLGVLIIVFLVTLILMVYWALIREWHWRSARVIELPGQMQKCNNSGSSMLSAFKSFYRTQVPVIPRSQVYRM